MKKSELIKLLKNIQGDFEVTTSDKKGIFQDIRGVEFQEWERKASGEKPEKHASITLILNGNDENKTKIEDKSDTIFEVAFSTKDEEATPNSDKQYAEDNKFIDKVNENLANKDKINKKDAFQARKAFQNDLKEIQNSCKSWFEQNYDKIARKAMIQLFEDEKPLDDKILPELKYYIYKNGWQNELPEDSFNNRFEILKLLYRKLEELIKEMVSQNVTTSWQTDSKMLKNEECCGKCKKEEKSPRKNDKEEGVEKGPDSLFDELISKMDDILTESKFFDGYFNMRPWIIW